jgi:hypothetical protein
MLFDTITTSLNSHFPAFNLFPLTMTTIIGAHCCSSLMHSVNRKAKRNHYVTILRMQWKPGKNFLFMAQQLLVGQGLLIFEASWSLSDTHILCRTPLDEWSAWRRDFFLATQHSQEKDIHAPSGFEPIISASERPQTHALDRAANTVARKDYIVCIFSRTPKNFKIFITFSFSDSQQVWIHKFLKAICQY